MKHSIPILLALLLPTMALSQDGFDFDFEGDGVGTGEVDLLEEVLETEILEKDFMFGFEDGEAKPAAAPTTGPQDHGATAKPADQVPELPKAELGEEYDGLLADNLKLRQQIADAEKVQQAASDENERLGREVKDLEGRIVQSTGIIQQLQKDKESAGGDPEKIRKLEESLAQAEQEKTNLGKQMAELEKSISELPASVPIEVEPVAAAPAPKAMGPRPLPGSDLFAQLEKEKAFLEKKVVEIEAQRRKADEERQKIQDGGEKARKEIEKLENETRKLRDQLSENKDENRTRDKLLRQIPDLEKQVEKLQDKSEEQELLLSAREQQLREARSELEVRERRLEKANRMQKMISEHEDELNDKNNQKLRDMHYNMAVVYAEKGQIRAAEQEFLRALRIDPMDADIHYNLGVLYDDEYGDRRKALMHYKRYLKLRSYAGDLDIVRGYIQRLEMK